MIPVISEEQKKASHILPVYSLDIFRLPSPVALPHFERISPYVSCTDIFLMFHISFHYE